MCVLQVSRLVVPIHGAPQSSLPALEDGDVLPVRAAGTLLVCTLGQKLIVGTLQLFQLLTRPPETCVNTDTNINAESSTAQGTLWCKKSNKCWTNDLIIYITVD